MRDVSERDSSTIGIEFVIKKYIILETALKMQMYVQLAELFHNCTIYFYFLSSTEDEVFPFHLEACYSEAATSIHLESLFFSSYFVGKIPSLFSSCEAAMH